jgi:hypothetical protein
MEAEAPEIHVLGPFTARKLVEKLARAVSLPVNVVEHQRLAEARVAEKPFRLEKLPPRTILVAFSRAMVLELKTMLETARRSVSVIYGSLPPEVRRRQSDRFADGTTEICVATDAVGMGLNLPADYVCFYEIEKFDGHEVRTLMPGEVQQIGGRAGRYGLSEGGEVGAIRRIDHEQVRKLFVAPPPALTHARVMPSVEALEMLSGSLGQRLRQWMQLGSIPDYLRDVLKTANLNEPIELAQMLRDDEVEYLGLASALRLISAPTRQTTRTYWRTCASAILTARSMPLPPAPPRRIHDQIHLEETEICIACADVYLWLGSRREFHGAAPDELQVRETRSEWTLLIDEALRHKIEAVRRCARCGRRLPKNHAYGVCDQCYHGVREY